MDQLFGFVGANGAGKATAMRIILGVLAMTIAASLIWPAPERVPESVRPSGEKTGSIFGGPRREPRAGGGRK